MHEYDLPFDFSYGINSCEGAFIGTGSEFENEILLNVISDKLSRNLLFNLLRVCVC